LVEEWRYMTKRQAKENFRRVKRRAGIVEMEEEDEQGAVEQAHQAPMSAHPPAPAIISQALPAVAEAVEEEEEEEEQERERGAAPSTVKRPTRLVKREEEREAKGRIEKEVRQATAPESPISELLRCV
jgi:hypothetical protein